MKHDDCQRYSNRDQLPQVTFFDVVDLVEVQVTPVQCFHLALSQTPRLPGLCLLLLPQKLGLVSHQEQLRNLKLFSGQGFSLLPWPSYPNLRITCEPRSPVQYQVSYSSGNSVLVFAASFSFKTSLDQKSQRESSSVLKASSYKQLVNPFNTKRFPGW